MTLTDSRDAAASVSSRPPQLSEPAKAQPVKVWAIVGAVFLAIEAYALVAWFVSGDATRTPPARPPFRTG